MKENEFDDVTSFVVYLASYVLAIFLFFLALYKIFFVGVKSDWIIIGLISSVLFVLIRISMLLLASVEASNSHSGLLNLIADNIISIQRDLETNLSDIKEKTEWTASFAEEIKGALTCVNAQVESFVSPGVSSPHSGPLEAISDEMSAILDTLKEICENSSQSNYHTESLRESLGNLRLAVDSIALKIVAIAESIKLVRS